MIQNVTDRENGLYYHSETQETDAFIQKAEFHPFLKGPPNWARKNLYVNTFSICVGVLNMHIKISF